MCEAMTRRSKYTQRCLKPLSPDQEWYHSRFCFHHSTLNRDYIAKYHDYSRIVRMLLDKEQNRHLTFENAVYGKRYVPKRSLLVTYKELIELIVAAQTAYEMRVAYQRRIYNGFSRDKTDGHNQEIEWMLVISKLCKQQTNTKNFLSEEKACHMTCFHDVISQFKYFLQQKHSQQEKQKDYKHQLEVFKKGGICILCGHFDDYCLCWLEFES